MDKYCVAFLEYDDSEGAVSIFKVVGPMTYEEAYIFSINSKEKGYSTVTKFEEFKS